MHPLFSALHLIIKRTGLSFKESRFVAAPGLPMQPEAD